MINTKMNYRHKAPFFKETEHLQNTWNPFKSLSYPSPAQ